MDICNFASYRYDPPSGYGMYSCEHPDVPRENGHTPCCMVFQCGAKSCVFGKYEPLKTDKR